MMSALGMDPARMHTEGTGWQTAGAAEPIPRLTLQQNVQKSGQSLSSATCPCHKTFPIRASAKLMNGNKYRLYIDQMKDIQHIESGQKESTPAVAADKSRTAISRAKSTLNTLSEMQRKSSTVLAVGV